MSGSNHHARRVCVSVNLLYVRREVALRPEVHERTSHVPVWVGHTTTSIPGRAKSVKRHATPCVCAVWMGQLSGTTQGTMWGPRRQWRRRRMSTALAHASALVAVAGAARGLYLYLYPRRTRASISSRTGTDLPTLPVQQQGPF